eukprot:TRINITY_DN1366_c0_g1_i2.p1 TRINITY_DN1366_c0_g1~~TRINITY_DN1366_c0_g1_i2.p1  ORF type:complete len:385 (-),score=26.13 TRINITY_DN1366_c0_g1_i2:62-1216(-)
MCDWRENYGASTSGGFCYDCTKVSWYHLIMGPLASAIRWLVLIYTIRSQAIMNVEMNQGLDRRNKVRAAILFKILLNYFQMITIILSLPLEENVMQNVSDNPESLSQSLTNTLVKFLKNSNGSSAGFSWDCLFRSIPWLDDIFTTINFKLYGFKKQSYEMPWFHFTFEVHVLALISIVYLMVLGVKKRSPHQTGMILGSLVIILFNALPNLQRATFSLFDCKNIGDKNNHELYMKGGYNVNCNSPAYLMGIRYVVMPVAVVLLVVIPIYIMMKIRSIFRRGRQGSNYNILCLGFLYYGFRSNVYFWEGLIFLRKLILIALIAYLSRYSMELQILAVMTVIQFAYAAQVLWKPYVDHDLNRLERVSLVSALVITLSGLYLSLIHI